MRRVDGIIGNRHDDPALADRVDEHERSGTLERVRLDAADRKKSRLRVETDAGTDLGIVVDRPALRAGDVLFVDEQAAAVVAFERREAYVIDLPEPSPETTAAAVELGHRVGNQHWDVAVATGADSDGTGGTTVYVPVAADRRILERVLADSLPPGATTRYEEVDAERFITDRSDRGPDHSHDGAKHEHAHGGGHGHPHNGGHDHADGGSHDHADGGDERPHAHDHDDD